MEVIKPSELEFASASLEWSRPPLSLVTNSPPQIPTLPKSNSIRRKPSLIHRINSSEDIPSSHESIFCAERFSNTNSEDNGSEPWPKITLSPIITPPTTTPILYGHGTVLTTIIEQKSADTMSTKASSANPRSTSEILLAEASIPALLGHQNSFDLPSTVTLRSHRRHRPFSADDLVFIKRSYHEACAMIERKIHDVAGPRTPIFPPIEQPSTPPGMPSWIAAQNGATRNTVQSQHWSVAGSPNQLQRFLGLRPSVRSSPIEFSSHIPVSIALQRANPSTQVVVGARSASSPLPTRVAPRFRPTRSGHGTGPLESHPFHHAGRADAKSDGVPKTTGTQLSNALLPARPGAPQGATSTAIRARRRLVRYPNIADRLQISGPSAFASHQIRRAHDEVYSQCPHRRGRQASLRSLNGNSEVIVPRMRHSMINYTPLSPNESQGDSSHQPISSPTVTEPHVGIEVPAHVSLGTNPVMTGAAAVTTPAAAPPLRSTPQTHRCWKCRASKLISSLGDVWEASANWCCWMFCGVGLYDDAGSQSCGVGNEVGLGPRRVIMDGMPVILY